MARQQEDVNMDEYFMGIALLCEKRSKDPRRQVGACVVNRDNQVIGTGYNGAPLNCHDCLIPWDNETKIPSTETDAEVVEGESSKQEPTEEQGKKTGKVNKEKSKQPHPKHDFVCHAEMNVTVNKDPKCVTGCTLYVTLFPCNECAKVIVRRGIKKIVYLSDDKADVNSFKAAKHILKSKGVTFEPFSPGSKDPYKLVLHFFNANKKEGSIRQTIDERNERKKKEELDKRIIGWKAYFMALAKFTAEMRSESDPKQGACIVNKDKRIVGLGFVEESMGPVEEAYDANLTVCHAPVSAIVNENPSSLRDCTMYVTHYPCKECAKVIVQSGIRRVIYLDKAYGRKKMEKEGITASYQPRGCVVERETELNDPTTRMFAIAHIKAQKYQISIDAADVINMEGSDAVKRKLDDEVTIHLDYAEVIPKKKRQDDSSSE